MRTAAINTSLDSDGLVEVRRILSSEAQIYDLETYQPANSVRQLMYRVRAAHMNALDGVLAKDPDLAPLEISAAQYVVISVLAKSKCVDSASQLCKIHRKGEPSPHRVRNSLGYRPRVPYR
jgi:hypothetical protein